MAHSRHRLCPVKESSKHVSLNLTDTGPFKALAKYYDLYLKYLLKQFPYKDWYEKISLNYHGTVNVNAKDNFGEIVVGVSISGIALKFPGRVSDSAMIGAGLYASKQGAAACIGTGELTMRLSSARMVVNTLENSISIQSAVNSCIKEINQLNSNGFVQILSLNQKGEVAADTNSLKERPLHFYVMNESDSEPRMIRTAIL